MIVKRRMQVFGEMQVKYWLHQAESSIRSLLAEKFRQAKISFLSKLGKSSRILSKLIHEASYRKTPATVMRIPLTQGFPLLFPGSGRGEAIIMTKLSKSIAD